MWPKATCYCFDVELLCLLYKTTQQLDVILWFKGFFFLNKEKEN